jgi:VanZ family protein
MLKRRLALPLVGILLVAVVLAPIPGGTRWIGALHDTAHGPIFGCVALLLLMAMRRGARAGRMRPWTQYAAAFCGSALLGVATELVQIPVGRDATFSDAALDVLGALAFLALFAAFDPALQQARALRSRIVLGLIAVPLLLVVVSPGVNAATAYARRADRFPVLADFSTRFDDYFIHPQWSVLTLAAAAREYARYDGERALRVQFQPGPYPGVDFPEPAPDWSGYTTLALDITNPHSSPFELLLRVHDASHTKYYEDRFNKVLRVAPRTRATLRVPLEEIRSAPQGRTMDMRRITDVLFFRTDASAAVPDIYVTRIWLE